MITYNKLDTQRNEIRLLKLLPGKGDDPVKCILQTVSLDHLPAYEALSYVWGDLNEKKTIKVDGTEHGVTTNLHAALQELRWRWRKRTLWVDALCINQDDTPEKNEQVPKMVQLYKTAQSVLAWLGPTATDPVMENVKMALGWLQTYQVRYLAGNRQPYKICKLLASNWSITMAVLRWVWLGSKGYFSERTRIVQDFEAAQALVGLSYLRANSYWGRMWTFQEFCLPDVEPTCCCGGGLRFKIAATITGNTDIRILEAVANSLERLMAQMSMITDNDHPNRVAARSSFYRWLDTTFRRAVERLNNNHNRTSIQDLRGFLTGQTSSLFSALFYTTRRECSDPRDRIYALYGMVPRLQVAFPLDYSKPVRTILLETTAFLLQDDEGIKTWGSFPMRRSHLVDDEYPSWVPDFTALIIWNMDLAPPLRHFGELSPVQFSHDLTTMRYSAIRVGRCRVLIRFSDKPREVLRQIQDLVCPLVDAEGRRRWRERVAWNCMSIAHKRDEHTPAAIVNTLDAIVSGTVDEESACTKTVCYVIDRLVGRTLFVLDDSVDQADLKHFGIAGADISDGDELVIPQRYPMPVVLRQARQAGSESEGRYRMVGIVLVDSLQLGLFTDETLVDKVVSSPPTEYAVW